MFTANSTLRPTRIAYLLRPNDSASLRKILRLNACLWGAMYNPIIPVFGRLPDFWKDEHAKLAAAKGYEIAAGYVRFFQPDVYVEAEEGLADKIGIRGLQKDGFHVENVCSLAEFLVPDDRGRVEPKFGLPITDVHQAIFEKEQKFVLRESRSSIIVPPSRGSFISEVIFGCYPIEEPLAKYAQLYRNTFKPDEIAASPDAWRKRFIEGATTPSATTLFEIEEERRGWGDFSILFFDETSSFDTIDAWNIRLEEEPTLLVPRSWAGELADDIAMLANDYFRPEPDDGKGIGHRVTFEFGRAINQTDRDQIIDQLSMKIPGGHFAVKHWRSPVWENRAENAGQKFRPVRINAGQSRHKTLRPDSNETFVSVPMLHPPFAEQYGGAARWANCVSISHYGDGVYCTRFPYNTFDRGWPLVRLGNEQVSVGCEGIVYLSKFQDIDEQFPLLSPSGAIASWLKHKNIKASISDAGRVSQELLNSLDAAGQNLLANRDLLHLLNRLANRTRQVGIGNEQSQHEFDGRHMAHPKIMGELQRMKRRENWRFPNIEGMVDFGMVRLGSATKCGHCQFENWHSLEALNYQLTCARCLKQYEFPQGNLLRNNANWSYRVIGPYATPDYARGSYAVVLVNRILQRQASNLLSLYPTVFSPSLNVTFSDGFKAESDFFLWWPESSNYGDHSDMTLAIGEAKSFGRNTFTRDEINKLKTLAGRLPGSAIIVATLKDELDDNEVKEIRSLAEWGRRPDGNGEPSHLVLVLTGIELFADYNIAETWKKLGAPFSNFEAHFHHKSIRSLSMATQQLYLNLEPYYEWRAARNRKTPKL